MDLTDLDFDAEIMEVFIQVNYKDNACPNRQGVGRVRLEPPSGVSLSPRTESPTCPWRHIPPPSARSPLHRENLQTKEEV